MSRAAAVAVAVDAAEVVPVVIVRRPLYGLRATYLHGRLYVARAKTAAATACRVEAARAELAAWLASNP
jgi:hypothetical protein